MSTGSHNSEIKSRLLAKLVREVLAVESFETLADLTDALKTRCARLHIGWNADAITECYRLIASNRPLIVHRNTAGARRVVEASTSPGISRDEARVILDRLGFSA